MTTCPLAAWKPVANHGGPMSAQLGLVLHVQEGNNSLAGWFNNPASGASSTYWVSKTGVLEQYVDATVCAWAQGSGNSTYQSVESEGYHTEALTAAQVGMLGELYAWGAATFGWPNRLAEAPGQPGLGWHGMGGQAWGGHVGCPGDLRKPQRTDILAAAFAGPTPTPTPPAPKEADMIAPPCTFTLNGVQQAFYVDANGRLQHHYAPPGRAWIGETVGAGWDPDSGLAYDDTTGVPQVWGVQAGGKRAQCYWSGSQWVTQPL